MAASVNTKHASDRSIEPNRRRYEFVEKPGGVLLRSPPAVEYFDVKESKVEKNVQIPSIVGSFVLVNNKD